MIRNIVDVKVNDDFTLECEMETGEVYKYDMSYVNTGPGEVTEPLRDIKVFKEVWIEWGALEWPSGYGLHGDTIARDGVLISKAA